MIFKAVKKNKNKKKPPYHLTPVKMAIFKTTTTNIGENVKQLEPLHIVGGNAKWCGCYEKQYGGSSKIINNRSIV